MTSSTPPSFEIAVWGPALDTYGAVVRLSVALYSADGQIVCGPRPATPIAALFQQYAYDPGLIADCVRQCLAQTFDARPAVVVVASGLAVVGVSLVRDEIIVGAVVCSYTVVGFSESAAIGRLARTSGVPFQDLWTTVRQEAPRPMRRLLLTGELLQVLGDTLLRENDLRRRADETARAYAHSASHDALTDLPNRVMMADRLTRAITVARRHQRPLAVLFLDLDDFKAINDSLGHMFGDELLRAVAQELTTCVRTSDTVSRHGGDEFVIVLAELERWEDAAVCARKINASLVHPRTLGGHELHISASIGISVYPDDGADAEALLRAADMALYRAKAQGRDGYQFFTPDLNMRALERRAIETGLHTALDQQEFALVYQPKVQLRSGALVGAEALIRWQHPERGLIEPAQFIAIAEGCGLIKPIGRWVVREACRQAQAWQDAGLPAIPVSVNVSAAEFRDHGFLPHMVDVLQQTRLDPRYLEIELTESVLMAQVDASNATLHALKNLGIQLAIDDFGTGWSSLSYLRHFPIDALKVDKSFVQEITSGSRTAPIISAVISMGKSLHHRVIAEGIETPDQLAFLLSENCGEGQGYLFSRPLLPQQFAQVLERSVVPPSV